MGLLSNTRQSSTLYKSGGISTLVNLLNQTQDDVERTQIRTYKRQVQVKLTLEQTKQLIQDRKLGATINELAKIYGIHRTTVMKRLKRKGA